MNLIAILVLPVVVVFVIELAIYAFKSRQPDRTDGE